MVVVWVVGWGWEVVVEVWSRGGVGMLVEGMVVVELVLVSSEEGVGASSTSVVVRTPEVEAMAVAAVVAGSVPTREVCT